MLKVADSDNTDLTLMSFEYPSHLERLMSLMAETRNPLRVRLRRTASPATVHFELEGSNPKFESRSEEYLKKFKRPKN